MDPASFPNLPLGVSDFHKLRETEKLYVDKTDLVAQLASKKGQFLLTRPRRFGKSLLISTFESLLNSVNVINGERAGNFYFLGPYLPN